MLRRGAGGGGGGGVGEEEGEGGLGEEEGSFAVGWGRGGGSQPFLLLNIYIHTCVDRYRAIVWIWGQICLRSFRMLVVGGEGLERGGEVV